jgi:hypothetical protein
MLSLDKFIYTDVFRVFLLVLFCFLKVINSVKSIFLFTHLIDQNMTMKKYIVLLETVIRYDKIILSNRNKYLTVYLYSYDLKRFIKKNGFSSLVKRKGILTK